MTQKTKLAFKPEVLPLFTKDKYGTVQVYSFCGEDVVYGRPGAQKAVCSLANWIKRCAENAGTPLEEVGLAPK